jgi:hypothetical protein
LFRLGEAGRECAWQYYKSGVRCNPRGIQGCLETMRMLWRRVAAEAIVICSIPLQCPIADFHGSMTGLSFSNRGKQHPLPGGHHHDPHACL